MKKFFLLFALYLISAPSSIAQRFDLYNYFNTTKAGVGSLMEKVGDKETENAIGIPYINKTFTLGNINGVEESVLIKYNAHLDEIELNNGDDKVFILPKDQEFNTITLKTGTIYKFVEYNNDDKKTKGYLVERFSQNDVSLLKREKIILIPEKQPVNGYGAYAPPKYERSDDEYFLQLKDKKVIAFPKNKKKVIEIFPSKKTEIEDYFKSNKLSFKEEADMIRITQFIATL